jgi:hypothetical protein
MVCVIQRCVQRWSWSGTIWKGEGGGKKARTEKKVGDGGVDLHEAARVASLLQLSCV